MMKILLRFTLLAFTLITSSAGWAATCSSNTGQPFIYLFPSPGTISVDPTVVLGAVLYQATIPLIATQATTVTCPTSSNRGDWGITTGTPGVLGSQNIYSTQIPGLAIKMELSGFGALPIYAIYPATFTSGGNWSVMLTLYKSGDLTQAGTFSGELASAVFRALENFQFVSIRLDGGFKVTPTRPTCDISTPSISVNLNSIPISQFSGPGSVSAEQPFNIGLQCKGAQPGGFSDVYVTLTDKTNTANRSDILSLTKNSTATGVGIQVLHSSTPVKFGAESSAVGNLNQWFAGTTGNGAFNIPLTARYLQTGANVTAGTANGIATFTMSYQ